MHPVQHYDDLIYVLSDPIFLLSGSGEILAANPAAVEMLGVQKTDIVQHQLTELVSNDEEKVAKYLKQCLQSKDPVLGSLHWRPADGVEVRCSCKGSLLPSFCGDSPPGIILSCTLRTGSGNKFSMLNDELEGLRRKHHLLAKQKDRLEEHVAERTQELRNQTQALAESNAQIRAILGSAADAIITFNGDYRVELINAAGEEIFQYSANEILGEDIHLIVPEYAVDNPLELQVESIGQRKDGTQFPMELSVAPVDQAEDAASGSTQSKMIYIAVMRDITERKKAQQAQKDASDQLAAQAKELERINKELDQFAYIASHDLKAPLRAIANLSEWIADDLEESMTEDTRKQLNLLKGRVHRMENLINAILQYSRVGRTTIEAKTINVTELLAEIIDSLSPPALFAIEVGTNMPTLSTPEVLLTQVFTNLISNAIKYHDEDAGRILITAISSGDFIQFCVADDGPGIAPEYYDKIFVIFQTLQARDKVESTGVGLTIVKKIIEGQGGRIWIEPNEPRGTKFCFTWPVQPRRIN